MSRRRNTGRYSTRNYGLINIGSQSANLKANLALQQIADIQGKLNVEYKRADISSSLNPGTAGAILDITQIAQGDGDQNRDGLQCKVVSVRTRWQLTQHASATQTFVRMMWFIDNEQDGAAPTPSEVLEDVDTSGLPNYVNRKRFSILKDVTYSLGDQTIADGKWYRKLNMIANWETTTAASHRNNALYFLYCSNEASNTPTLVIRHRTRFLDN